MIRILEYDTITNQPITIENASLEKLPQTKNKLWIDIQAISSDEISILAEKFNLHPLALEDIVNLNQRPKIEDYGEYSFIVLHSIHFLKPNSLRIREIHLFPSRISQF